jgi:hypothetical protein
MLGTDRWKVAPHFAEAARAAGIFDLDQNHRTIAHHAKSRGNQLGERGAIPPCVYRAELVLANMSFRSSNARVHVRTDQDRHTGCRSLSRKWLCRGARVFVALLGNDLRASAAAAERGGRSGLDRGDQAFEGRFFIAMALALRDSEHAYGFDLLIGRAAMYSRNCSPTLTRTAWRQTGTRRCRSTRGN